MRSCRLRLRLLDGDALGEIRGLSTSHALQHGDVIGEQLQGHDVTNGWIRESTLRNAS